jgi:peptide/nickel transport system ATP-binding protein
MSKANPILQVRDLTKQYPVRSDSFIKGLFNDSKYLTAVDGVDCTIREGEIVGLAGQSGSGKSTLAELFAHLETPTEGDIMFKGDHIVEYNKTRLKKFRRECQFIFQNPYNSLNPRFTVETTVTEPLKIHDIGSPSERQDRIVRALEDAGLTPPRQYFDRRPDELSGGERQRVAIARALVLEPEILIADEPVSMLDVSVSTSILNTFKELQESRNLSMLYISHDLATINYLADRTMVMYLGDIVERGPTDQVIHNPSHPYTESLLQALPEARSDTSEGSELDESGPDPTDLPEGCRFRSDCKYATEKCANVDPVLESVENDHETACHHPLSNGN